MDVQTKRSFVPPVITASGDAVEKAARRLSRYRFAAFAAGFLCCFLALVVAGQYTAHINSLSGVKRFYQQVSPEGQFYPTARQVWQLTLSQVCRDKVNVIIGGSSVMYGNGQPAGATVADRLQEALGDGYVVLNLAMPGGRLTGQGLFVAERLMKEGYPIIFIADLWLANPDRDKVLFSMGWEVYHYFYWDARFNGFLLPWQPREAGALMLLGFHSSDKALGALANVPLAFNELWTALAYHRLGLVTIPSIVTWREFWKPRGSFPDVKVEAPHYDRWQTEVEKATVEGAIFLKLHDENLWGESRSLWTVSIPGPMRPFIVIVNGAISPATFGALPADIQTAMRKKMLRQRDELVKFGLSPVIDRDGFDADDYVDIQHLSVIGARKLADRMAEAVRVKAREVLGR
ncbi:MAG: hypothetical protein ABSF52_23560 [Syntrophobacteraceae bacterium]